MAFHGLLAPSLTFLVAPAPSLLPQSLGLRDPKSQEKAIAPVSFTAESAKSPTEAQEPNGRLGALRGVWGLKVEPERWRRG